MTSRIAFVTRWTVRVLVAFALLLMLLAAGLWWWSGQEGSLKWLFERLDAGGWVKGEGARGSVRGRIAR